MFRRLFSRNSPKRDWLRHRRAFRGAGNDPDLQWVFLPLMIDTACTEKYRTTTLYFVDTYQRADHPSDLQHWNNIFHKVLRNACTADELRNAYMHAPSDAQRAEAKQLLMRKIQADEQALSNKPGQCRYPGSVWRMYINLIDCALIHKDLAFAKWGLALLHTHIDNERIRNVEWHNRRVRVEELEQDLAA